MKRKLESLPPIIYDDLLEERAKDLNRIIKLKNKILQESEHLDSSGKIRIVRHRNIVQFYLITRKNDTTGKYLPRSQDEFAHSLIQYDYDKKVFKAAKKELNAVRKLLKIINKNGIQIILKRFSQDRKKLVTPVTLSDEDFAATWLSKKYTGKNIYNPTEYFTAKGEQVRSKSEVIIADTLNRMKIPYRYEYPLELKNGRTIHPDFCCLNVHTRQEIFWEHFGLMDDSEYVSTVIQKINGFQECGFYPGKNFIFTMENAAHPLNPKTVKKIAEFYLA
ncbi:MAG: hypothetical protein MJ169_06540 [Treponema sp.]|nr:hypothetical protein [Treponema sp.]